MGGSVQRSPVRPGMPHILLSLMHCALGYSHGGGSLPSTLPLKVTSSTAAPNAGFLCHRTETEVLEGLRGLVQLLGAMFLDKLLST